MAGTLIMYVLRTEKHPKRTSETGRCQELSEIARDGPRAAKSLRFHANQPNQPWLQRSQKAPIMLR